MAGIPDAQHGAPACSQNVHGRCRQILLDDGQVLAALDLDQIAGVEAQVDHVAHSTGNGARAVWRRFLRRLQVNFLRPDGKGVAGAGQPTKPATKVVAGGS